MMFIIINKKSGSGANEVLDVWGTDDNSVETYTRNDLYTIMIKTGVKIANISLTLKKITHYIVVDNFIVFLDLGTDLALVYNTDTFSFGTYSLSGDLISWKKDLKQRGMMGKSKVPIRLPFNSLNKRNMVLSLSDKYDIRFGLFN